MIKSTIALIATLAPLPALAPKCQPPEPPPACAAGEVFTLGEPGGRCTLVPGTEYVLRMPADDVIEARCAQIGGTLDWTSENYQLTGYTPCVFVQT